MDKCLEKKIYDRQIKKQGMSDRVVDECNPDAHLSIKDVTNLCYDYNDDEEKSANAGFEKPLDSYTDTIMKKILTEFKSNLTKEPFFHESLLVDRKNEKLSQAEKRQAHRSYEMQKKTSSKQAIYSSSGRIQYQTVRKDGTLIKRPIASVGKRSLSSDLFSYIHVFASFLLFHFIICIYRFVLCKQPDSLIKRIAAD